MAKKPNEIPQLYRPLHKLIATLESMVKEQGNSYNKLETMAATDLGVEISRFQIKTVSYNNFAETKIINTLDSYFNVVLKLIGKTDDELLALTNNRSNAVYHSDAERALSYLDTDVREFVLNMDNKEYIDFAYGLYKQKKDKEKMEEKMKKLSE